MLSRSLRNIAVVTAVMSACVSVGSTVSGQRAGDSGLPPKRGGLSLSGDRSPKPDLTRFVVVPVVPDGELDEPMMFDVANGGKVYIAERKGALKVHDPVTRTTKTIAVIPVNYKYIDAEGKPGREAEEGLIGLALDPNFEQNHWIYLQHADLAEPKHVLSRWEIRDDRLVESSRVDLLSFYVQRRQCCHVGGGIEFDSKGNLYLTVGSNSPEDLSAVDPNDLRGKILRIHPEPDGSYTIPRGNLFPVGAPNARPEIFAMGVRNPWRVGIDNKTGWVYWGEIGDGYDEFNLARKPGFFGWPYFEGDNATRSDRTPLPPLREDLPPARPPLISYDSGVSQYPILGAGTRCAVGGPVYRRSDFATTAKRPWPTYFEGKWLVTDCVRSWILAIATTADGEYRSMEGILPEYRPSTPLDMKFGPDGDLYVLEYGVNFFMRNETARLRRVEFHAGNRTPIANASAERTGGSIPLDVALSAIGSKDPDGQPLRYRWTVRSAAGGEPRVFARANPVVSFTSKGVYTAMLTVRDPAGAEDSKSVTIVAGNAPPTVTITVTGNEGFYVPGQPFDYSVHVADSEDQTISRERIALSIDYVPEGFDVSSVRLGDRPVDAMTRFSVASALMRKSNCGACHSPSQRTVGPAMVELAEKYRPDDETLSQLARKVRSGGLGAWGRDVAMPPHPGLTLDEARTIVRAMLSIKEEVFRNLPLSGRYTPRVPPQETGSGVFLIHAAYTDNGADGLPPLTADAIRVLRSPLIMARNADVKRGVTGEVAFGGIERGVKAAPESYIGFKEIGLSGVSKLALWLGSVDVGGTIEIRQGSPTGTLLASETIAASPPKEGLRGGAYGGIEGGVYDNVGAAAAAVLGPPTVTVTIKPLVGVHAVYLVFKNPAARPTDTLMTINAVKFVFGE